MTADKKRAVAEAAATDQTSKDPDEPHSAPTPQRAETAGPDPGATILLHAQPPGERGVFVLGCYEQRITIHSQQIRALNLVYALKASGLLDGVASVAVIGGGISGMTAAVAAASVGATVTLFERHPEVLHLLRGCHTRHIHPNIYDWPAEHSTQATTALPFLNWTADTADRVASTLVQEWDALTSMLNITVRTGVRVAIGEPTDKGRRIDIRSPQFETDDFTLVILAVGFGKERTIAPQPVRSYWRDDALHQPEVDWTDQPTTYLVSGNGDGGLIDLIRLRLRDFRHETLMDEIMSAGDMSEIERELLSLEVQFRGSIATSRDPGRQIYRAYQKLESPAFVDQHLSARLRRDTRVTFNFLEWPFTLRSSILHRFLVSRLLAIDKSLSGVCGRLIAVDGHEPELAATFRTSGGTVSETFNRAIIRHGPRASMEESFPGHHEVWAPALRARNDLDDTRRRRWPDSFFPDILSPSSLTGKRLLAPHECNDQVQVEPCSPSDKAVILRSSLVDGLAVAALEQKLKLLSESDRAFVLRGVAEVALRSEEALRGFQRLAASRLVSRNLLIECVNSLVRHAVYDDSMSRKMAVLEDPADILNASDQTIIVAFFEDILDIVDRDRYDEVNLIVPKLALAQDAIPRELRRRYVLTMLLQAGSASFQGAPAARRVVNSLDGEFLEAALALITTEFLYRYGGKDSIQSFLEDHIEELPATMKDQARTRIEDGKIAFVEKYQSLLV